MSSFLLSCPRYLLFGDYMTQVLDMLATAVAQGKTNHMASMGGVLDQVSSNPDSLNLNFLNLFLNPVLLSLYFSVHNP